MENQAIFIGAISNYCGGLQVKDEGGKFYWRTEDTCDTDNWEWEEIDQQLYDELVAWEKRRVSCRQKL